MNQPEIYTFAGQMSTNIAKTKHDKNIQWIVKAYSKESKFSVSLANKYVCLPQLKCDHKDH
jgi:hypothetical protein